MKNRLFSPRKHQQQQQEGQQQEEVKESSSASTTTSSIASVTSPPYHDTLSRSGNENDTTNTTTTRPSILWSAILRNDTILVEADLGAAVHKEVEEASTLLLHKPPTPGWEHATLGKRKVQAAAAAAAAASGNNGNNDANHNHNGKLKGMKFHVYEHFAEKEEDQRDDDDDGQPWKDYDTAPQNRPVQRRYKNEGLTIWTFACVYDPTLVDFIQVQSFLEKVVTVTEVFRQPTVQEEASKQQEQDDDDPRDEQQVTSGNFNPFDDDDLPPHTAFTTNHRSPQDVWRYGSHHAAQYFAPVLLQRMEEVSYHGKLAMCHEKVDAVKEIMSRNIDLILENEERLAHGTLEKAVQLNDMAKVFAKRSKQVKRQMLWNNAKHGAILGTAITAGVAVCVVPPLVALL